jgi:TP901-1 family phage major tail protein
MAIFSGTDLVLKVQAVNGAADEYKLMHCTTCSLSINSDTIDVSTKDSEGWKDLLGGQKSFSLSGDGFMDFASTGSTTDPDELLQNLFDRDAVTFTFALDVQSGYKLTGSGFITSVEISGGTEDAPTYSVSIDGSGPLTKTAV